MHSSFRIGETTVMASDGQCQGKPEFKGFSLSIEVANEGEAEVVRRFITERKVQMPLSQTFFSSRFGMVADRFGVSWMVIVAHK